MAENTGISWCDATWNPWWGCTKVSPACDHCYAERDAKRFAPARTLWGVDAERRTFGDKHWNEPRRWARTLPAKLGRRPRVFCASMADVLDNQAPVEERVRLFRLIAATPELDWLLLTKRIGNAWPMMLEVAKRCGGGEQPIKNVWLGATVVNQAEADRDIPKLLATPAHVRFLSIEPMIGPIDLRHLQPGDPPTEIDALAGTHGVLRPHRGTCVRIDWVIAGGESGPHARPAHPGWFRSLRDQCAAVGVPFHFKQFGEWAPGSNFPGNIPSGTSFDFDGTLQTADQRVWRVGKKAAGRTLDGVTHDGFPG
jgi:protein gp37